MQIKAKRFDGKNNDMIVLSTAEGRVTGIVHSDLFWGDLGVAPTKGTLYRRLEAGEEVTLNVEAELAEE